MSIVSRIKQFMSEFDIPSSQFADECNIPRPTISQILGGRNKKISDEIINKIHIAYPDLSIMWLMFGEGNMMTTENIKISSSQNSLNLDLLNYNIFDSEDITNENNKKSPTSELQVNKHKNNNVNENNQQQTNKRKKIVNILVFYEDNSFESFLPNRNQQ